MLFIRINNFKLVMFAEQILLLHKTRPVVLRTSLKMF